MMTPDESSAKEGDCTFYRGGVVMLGSESFSWPGRIPNHEWSGCVAKRGRDGILVVKSPTGREFRYQYFPSNQMWYRLIPCEAPMGLFATWWAEYSYALYEYGFFVGTFIYLLQFLLLKVACTYVTVNLIFVAFAMFIFSGGSSSTEDNSGDGVLLAVGFTWVFFFFRGVYFYASTLHKLGITGIFWSLIGSTICMWPIAASAFFLSVYYNPEHYWNLGREIYLTYFR